MALSKHDIEAIDAVVTKRTTEATEELARLVNDGFEDMQNALQTTQNLMTVEFRKVNTRLDALDIWHSEFRDLVKLLAAKKVLTAEEAAHLGVQLDRPAA